MTVKIGVIADDFTGATDIAGFMTQQGWRVTLLSGQPAADMPWDEQADAIVISLKSRALSAQHAVAQSLACQRWLQQQAGAKQLYVKYCSTFDSTPEGNIGPVSDALLAQTEAPFIVHCPALPQNGRTLVHGHLFVHGVLLNECGMQNHPLNPMQDASLPRLLAQQTAQKIGRIDLTAIRQGEQAVRHVLRQAQQQGIRHVIADTLTEDDLATLAAALQDQPLLAGGSGLGGALAAISASDCTAQPVPVAPQGKYRVVLSGSCSRMTQRQVTAYKTLAPWLALDIARCMAGDEAYIVNLTDWVLAQSHSDYAPLIYATQPPEVLAQIQQRYGQKAASDAVENTFAKLAQRLRAAGVNTFIVAGGETSGTVVEALQVRRLRVGRPIVPGVPWVYEAQSTLALALKSGNFGDEDFFVRAQEPRP